MITEPSLSVKDVFPPELLALKQWGTWRNVQRATDKKPTKVPYQLSGREAKSNDPRTWTTFDRVEHLEHKAFFLAKNNLVGIDLDGCILDDGTYEPWAKELLNHFRGLAYAEVSPSGTGIKLLAHGKKAEGAKCVHTFPGKRKQIEVYASGRFWTVTGQVLDGFQSLENAQEQINWLCQKYLMRSRSRQPERSQPAPATRTDRLYTHAERYVDRADTPREGSRNATAFSLAGHLSAFVDEVGAKLSESEITSLLHRWNGRLPEPLGEAEIQQCIQSARRNGTPREPKIVKHTRDVILAPSPSSSCAKSADRSAENDALNSDLIIQNFIEENDCVEPIPLGGLARGVINLLGGPHSLNGRLFIVENANVRFLDSASALFGWLRSKHKVRWRKAEHLADKSEFFAELTNRAKQYWAINQIPHFPSVDGIYYTCPQVASGDGSALSEFLDFFSPSTPVDRQLLLAFVATLFWGGPPGKRAGFCIVSPDAQGAGKTTLVTKLATIAGGEIKITIKQDRDTMMTRLLGGDGSARVYLADNVKANKVSSESLEELMTSESINGHAMYRGLSVRPNLMTGAITINAPTFSRDIAQRFVIISINTPKRSGDWDSRIDHFIASNKERIWADVKAFFDRAVKPMSSYIRWSAWQREVVGRLDDPDAALQVIRERQLDVDADAKEARVLEEALIQHYRELLATSRPFALHIPNKTMEHWFRHCTDGAYEHERYGTVLDRFIATRMTTCITRNPCRTNGRGWILRTPGAEDAERFTVDYRLAAKEGD